MACRGANKALLIAYSRAAPWKYDKEQGPDGGQEVVSDII